MFVKQIQVLSHGRVKVKAYILFTIFDTSNLRSFAGSFLSLLKDRSTSAEESREDFKGARNAGFCMPSPVMIFSKSQLFSKRRDR